MEIANKVSSNPLVSSGIDFSNLTRDEFQEVIRHARMRGINLTEHDGFFETIERFKKEFELRDGKAKNTRRNLKACWRYYSRWCEENGYSNLLLPSSPAVVEEYLIYRASFVSISSLKLDCWALATMHRIAGCPDPIQDFNVDTTKKRLYRELTEKSDGVKQAYGFRQRHLDELGNLLKDSYDQMLLRTLTIAYVAYESMLRESEMVAIKISHILVDVAGNSLKIPRTKTNKSGEPEYAYLSNETLGVIKRYLKLSGRSLKSEGYLFGPLSRTRKPLDNNKPISVDTIDRAFHQIHKVLELDDETPRFSSHSARVGASQDLAVKNYTATKIATSGRWNSEKMVYHYCRRFFSSESGMADMRKKHLDIA